MSITKTKLSDNSRFGLFDNRNNQFSLEPQEVKLLGNIADLLFNIAMNATTEGAHFVSMARERESELSRTVALALRNETVISALAKTRRRSTKRRF
jgi:hypothetical protein